MYKNKTNKLQENCHSFFTFSVGIFLLKSIWLCFKMHFRQAVWKKVFFRLFSAPFRHTFCLCFFIYFSLRFFRIFLLFFISFSRNVFHAFLLPGPRRLAIGSSPAGYNFSGLARYNIFICYCEIFCTRVWKKIFCFFYCAAHRFLCCFYYHPRTLW